MIFSMESASKRTQGSPLVMNRVPGNDRVKPLGLSSSQESEAS
jgi:hypothetical protein